VREVGRARQYVELAAKAAPLFLLKEFQTRITAEFSKVFFFLRVFAVCCSVLHCVAMCVQCVAVCCSVSYVVSGKSGATLFSQRISSSSYCNYPRCFWQCGRHCNTLQSAKTHFSTLQHTATHCNTLQHTQRDSNTMQLTTTQCNTL